jgi:hypothetical protein
VLTEVEAPNVHGSIAMKIEDGVLLLANWTIVFASGCGKPMLMALQVDGNTTWF